MKMKTYTPETYKEPHLKRCSMYSVRELLMKHIGKLDVAEMCNIAKINCKIKNNLLVK